MDDYLVLVALAMCIAAGYTTVYGELPFFVAGWWKGDDVVGEIKRGGLRR